MVAIRHGEPAVRVEKTITVNRPQEEVFRFWRNLENLPRFMTHLESVKMISDVRSHWVTKGPAGAKLEWDADIVNEMEPERIGWESLKNSDIDHAGSVHFKKTQDGQGTEVHVVLRAVLPEGPLGTAFAKLFDESYAKEIEEDLLRFKEIMEAGKRESKDAVEEASEESFPASDPPSWTSPEQ